MGVNVDWDHELLVPVDEGEGGVSVATTGARACDQVDADHVRRVECLSHEEVLVVTVTKGREPHDMLIALHEGMIPHAELMEAAVDRNVRDHIRKAALFLQAGKLILEPLNLLSRILPVVEEPPVQVVACLSVQRNDLAFGVEWKRLRVVAVFREGVSLGFRQPVGASPIAFDVIDGPVGIWGREVLHVDWPGVVVAEGRENLYLRVGTQGILESLCNSISVFSDFLIGIVPDVMS